MSDKRVLIAGAAGLVGRCFTARLSGHCVVRPFGHAELDVTDPHAVERTCTRERPDVIVNCTVFGVDACERDPERGHAVNAAGPGYLAGAATTVGAVFVQFSSNYVFDGARTDDDPYTIADQPRPLNQYGRAKLDGERLTQSACERSFIIRSSWVYGAGKRGFAADAFRRLRAGERVEAIADIWANTTAVDDLVVRTLDIVESGRYGTYQIVNAGVCSYYDVAVEVGGLSGLPEDQLERLIVRSTATDARWDALRPRYTPMRCLASEELGLPPMRHWRTALVEHFRTLSR